MPVHLILSAHTCTRMIHKLAVLYKACTEHHQHTLTHSHSHTRLQSTLLTHTTATHIFRAPPRPRLGAHMFRAPSGTRLPHLSSERPSRRHPVPTSSDPRLQTTSSAHILTAPPEGPCCTYLQSPLQNTQAATVFRAPLQNTPASHIFEVPHAGHRCCRWGETAHLHDTTFYLRPAHR